MVASLQYSFDKGDNCWLEDHNVKGEFYCEEYSVVTHWFDYQEHLTYPICGQQEIIMEH